MDKRLNVALRTPNSGLTSSEALKLLDGLNTVDTITFRDRLGLKHTLQYEISELEKAEIEYFEKVCFFFVLQILVPAPNVFICHC